MDTQNVTLSLPKDILLKAKLIAVRRQMSLSGLLTQTLERLVRQDEAFARARERHLAWLEAAADLGTGGAPLGNREELHGRD